METTATSINEISSKAPSVRTSEELEREANVAQLKVYRVRVAERLRAAATDAEFAFSNHDSCLAHRFHLECTFLAQTLASIDERIVRHMSGFVSEHIIPNELKKLL